MKSLKEFSEAYGRHDAYTRDYHSSISGMGKRQSHAYHADGGANDEGWDDHKPSHKPADHPHSVHINGKKWKTFGSHSHATNVARKIKGATVHKEEVEIQEDVTTSEYKVKKFVGQDGKTHQRKVRPHTVHFKNSKTNAEPEEDKERDDKEDMKKEDLQLSSFTEYLSPLEESQVDHWKKVQAMDKGSATGGKEEAKKHLAYLNAVHDYHKKYGNDTKKIKDKIESMNRSRIAEDLEEGYVVRYNNPKSEKHGSEKHFDSQESANKHAARGNSVDKIGGKYTVHKTNEKGHDVKEEVELDEAIDPSEVAGNPRMYSADTAKKAYYHKKASESDKESLAKHLDRHHGNKNWRKPVKEESELDEKAPPGFEGTVKAMKKHKEIDNPYALAWYLKNKGAKSHRKADGTVKEEEMKSYKQFVESLAIQTEQVVEEEVVDEANAFDWKSGGHKTSGKYDVKQVGNRTIVTRKYDPETGHSTGTDEPASTEKRGRGRPAGSKSGAKQKGSGKSNDYRGIPQHSLNLPK